MTILIMILFTPLMMWLFDLLKFLHNLTVFYKQVNCCDYSISRVSSGFSNHLFHTCKRYLPDTFENRNRYFRIIKTNDLDDDEDVLGKEYLLTYTDEILKMKYTVNVAKFKYYYDKPYKNKKELILWLDKDAFPEQNFFAKHVKKITMDLVQNRLKKRLRA